MSRGTGTIDLRAPWYRDPANLSYKIDRYVGQLQLFELLNWGRVQIQAGQVRARVLDLIFPKGGGTQAQLRTIKQSIDRARDLGVQVFTYYY
jgi:hypothetical protein